MPTARRPRRSRARTLLVLTTLVVLGAAGCAPEAEITLEEQVPAEMRETEPEGGGDAGGGGDAATFVAVDIAYEDPPSELVADGITIELVNNGNLPHNVVFEEPGDVLVAEAQGGETATGTIELTPGTYTYYCSVPGHREAGMEGVLTVTGS